ncbi:MAG TPA: PEP-CTERM sorting domain-containing protein, partial [Lacipirellulaceae bacterium]|nr:PEP-CTERM sorting domain-containing protein [Lacipirellulaceae bacterium]
VSWTSRICLIASARAILSALVVVGLAACAVPNCSAALFTLNDNNSLAQFDSGTQANNFNWFVDGNDVLAQQAFWFRVGDVPEQSVHTLPIAIQGTSDSNFDGNPDTLFVRYNGAGFRIDTRYVLDGGMPGSGASDMGEQISITNTLDSPLPFHFFQYADFDIGFADSAVFTNENSVRQFSTGSELTETVVTPVPAHREIAPFPVTLSKLNGGVPTVLSDTPPIGVVAGPNDLTWAYQWDFVLAPGATFQISKDKNLHAGPSVPEPATTSLLMLAAGTILAVRRRR